MSSGSSRRTVPAPTITASQPARSWCTMRRLSRQRDPAGVAAGRGDLAVERHGGLVGDQRQAGALVLEERRVLLPRPRRPAVVAEVHLDARFAQPRDAVAVDARVRVAQRDHDPRHPGRDDRVGARRREAVVAARLERAVQRGAAAALAGLAPARRPRRAVRRGRDGSRGRRPRRRRTSTAPTSGLGCVRPTPARPGRTPRPCTCRRPTKTPRSIRLQGGRRRRRRSSFSHPDCDRRPRSLTWSTPHGARGLYRRWGTFTPP